MSRVRLTAIAFCALGVLIALFITGCAVFEPLFGIKPKGESDGTGGVVGTIINYLIPGAGALVAAGAGVYADLKRREWKKAAISTFSAINAVAGTGPLKEVLAKAHAAAGVSSTVEAALDMIEGPERTHAPEAPKA